MQPGSGMGRKQFSCASNEGLMLAEAYGSVLEPNPSVPATKAAMEKGRSENSLFHMICLLFRLKQIINQLEEKKNGHTFLKPCGRELKERVVSHGTDVERPPHIQRL